MASDYTDEFFRWTFSFEVEHKDRLDAADGTLITVVLVLGAVGAYYMQIWPQGDWGFWQWAFLIVSGSFLISFATATFFVLASIWPRKKALPSKPNEYLGFVEKQEKFHRHYHQSEDKVNARVESELREMLRGNLISAANDNREMNLEKIDWQVKAKKAIGLVIILIFVNILPSFFCLQANRDGEKKDVHKVEIKSMPSSNGAKP